MSFLKVPRSKVKGLNRPTYLFCLRPELSRRRKIGLKTLFSDLPLSISSVIILAAMVPTSCWRKSTVVRAGYVWREKSLLLNETSDMSSGTFLLSS